MVNNNNRSEIQYPTNFYRKNNFISSLYDAKFDTTMKSNQFFKVFIMKAFHKLKIKNNIKFNYFPFMVETQIFLIHIQIFSHFDQSEPSIDFATYFRLLELA